MLELIVLSSWLGILAFVVAPLILLYWATYTESPVWGALTVLVASVALFVIGDVHVGTVLNAILANPFVLIKWGVVYVALAIVWALFKWWILCRDKLKEYNANKDKWKAQWERNPTDPFAKWVSLYYQLPPSPRKYEGKITTWMLYWPVSIVSTLIGDFIYRFFKWVYNYVSTVFTKIASLVFAGTELTP